MPRQGTAAAAAAAPAAVVAAAAVAACGCPQATMGSPAWGALHCRAPASVRVSLHSAGARLRPCARTATLPAAAKGTPARTASAALVSNVTHEKEQPHHG